MSSRFLFLAAVFGFLARPVLAQDDWTRNFRAGLLIGVNIKADFRTSGQFALTANDPGMTGVGGINHQYDDGYVRVDDTGNAQGFTGYWGYQNANQYDGASTLTFHSSRSVTLAGATSSGRDDSPYLGLDLAYGGTFGQSLGARLGWEVGFDMLPISITDNRNLSGTFTRTVHTFSTGSIIPPLAPYNGGPTGFGEPLIGDVASGAADDVAAATITGSRTLDVHLLALRFGPTLYWPLYRRFAVSVSGGGAVGLVTGDYRFNESATFSSGGTTHISGHFGETKTTYGGYFNALALYHLQPDADLFLGVQFMPLTGVTFSRTGREAKLDMSSALYFTAGINWPF